MILTLIERISSTTTSVDLRENTLNVYPNPAQDFVQVYYSDLELKTGTLEIVDMQGKSFKRTF